MNFNLKAIVSLCGIFSLSIAAATTSDVNSKVISIAETTQRIHIDGHIDPTEWANATRLSVNNVTWPDENVRADVDTSALLLEDGQNLYVAFIASDPNPEEIRAFLTDRDSNWNDDRVMVKIDTYADHTLAYQFIVNPLGTQSDAIENEITKSESAAWDGIWDSAGQITPQGYQVEIAIPLSILNFEEGLDIQRWGLELVRFYPRDKNYRISSARMSQNNPCWICQMPIAEGFKNAEQGNNLTLVPTFVTGVSETRDPVETFAWDQEQVTDVGLDVKWGVTPDVTLNATFNPDFSQVEADAGQLNVNNTFGLYLQEKRTFFLENQDYFTTPVNLIYTRNVNQPDYGVKATGKIGDHSLGAFIANDKSANFILPGNLGSSSFEVEKETTNAAVRYRYSLNNELSLGALSTVRENSDYKNYVGSFDIKYQPSVNDTFSLQIINTDTQHSEDLLSNIQEEFLDRDESVEQTTLSFNEQYLRSLSANGSAMAYHFDYRHENRDWVFRINHIDIGEKFRADLAFFNQVDRSKTVIGGAYVWRGEEDNWWTRIRIEGDIDATYDQSGENLEEEAEIFLNINGPSQSFIRHGLIWREKVAGRHQNDIVFNHKFDGHLSPKFAKQLLHLDNNSDRFQELEFRSWIEFKPTANFWYGNFFKLGENIDYGNQRLANTFVWEPNISWNINTHLKSRFSYTYSEMEYDDKNVFTANLVDFRLTYQFSIKSFLRLTTVFTDVERNLANYNEPDDWNKSFNALSAQLLYSYKVNPQTLFFVGYSEGGFQNDDLSKRRLDNRSVFMKLSYAWLM